MSLGHIGLWATPSPQANRILVAPPTAKGSFANCPESSKLSEPFVVSRALHDTTVRNYPGSFESRRFSTVEGDELDDSKLLTVDEHESPTWRDLIFRQSAADSRTRLLRWFTWLALLIETPEGEFLQRKNFMPF